jgi:hypothetical protein
MEHSKPRALVVHPDVLFINPTTRLWPSLFTATCDVTFFGTGFQTDETLRRGLSRFLDTQEDTFDLVVVSEQVSNPAGRNDLRQRARFLQRNYGYSSRDAITFLESKDRWLADALAMGLPTIFTFFEFDPYRVKPEWVEIIDKAHPYIMGWGREFVKPLMELEHLDREVFTSKATDDWHDLLLRHADDVVSLPAFVSAEEFCFQPLAERSRQWSVLGTTYSDRRAARKSLSESGASLAGVAHSNSVAALDRLTGGRIGNSLVRWWTQRGFRSALRKSQASFTCGSGLEYPVRKFFEIPAAGAVLVARSFPGMTHLGFVDGENFISASPSSLSLITEELLTRDLETAQGIARRGQLLVEAQHSLEARTRQLPLALERILRGTFRGSEWCNGEWILAT